MFRYFARTFFIAAIFAASIGVAQARGHGHHRGQGEQADQTGIFDYYLLSLSWSPTYCLTHGNDIKQCGNKGLGFVLHGLWPQFATGGYPRDCATDERLTEQSRRFAETIFPSPKLVDHEWNKHGTCSGLGALAYFKAADSTRTSIRIPAALDAPAQTRSMSVAEIISAFTSVNPGMRADSLVVACSGPELAEVRFCFGRNLSPVGCGKGVVSNCRRGAIRIPAIR